jgi:hypothetical protein
MTRNPVILFFVLIIAACGASHPLFQPTENEAKKISTDERKISIDDLRNGYSLYITNCGGCHALPVPVSKNKKDWDKLLPEMFSKIHLDNKQEELIRNYIYSKL